jgi:hypothetical protein
MSHSRHLVEPEFTSSDLNRGDESRHPECANRAHLSPSQPPRPAGPSLVVGGFWDRSWAKWVRSGAGGALWDKGDHGLRQSKPAASSKPVASTHRLRISSASRVTLRFSLLGSALLGAISLRTPPLAFPEEPRRSTKDSFENPLKTALHKRALFSIYFA